MELTDLPLRMTSRIRVSAEGCWEWTGAGHANYGQIRTPDGNASTHRVVYEMVHGKIPDGLQVDHLCCNRRCCNPEHLEAVTPAENMRRYGLRTTHCVHGHAYDLANMWVDKNGHKFCRTCHRTRELARYTRRRDEALTHGLPWPPNRREA